MSAKRISRVLAAVLAAGMLFGGVTQAQATPDPETPECASPESLVAPSELVAERVASGEIRVTWAHDGTCAQGYQVTLRLAKSSVQDQQILHAASTDREILLPNAVLTLLGAPVGSGRHFYVRLQTVGESSVGALSPAIVTLAGQPADAPAAGATRLRVAAYNLAFTPELSRRALAARRSPVARQLVAAEAAVIALNESVQVRGAADTQLDTLLSKIRSAQRKTGKSAAWRLTRSTLYARPGQVMGGDGTRILYNKHRVRLLSSCQEVTKTRKTVVKRVTRGGKLVRVRKQVTVTRPYSQSCTIKLPRIGGTIYQRWAPIVRFQDRKTGQKFWFVSAHLEVRKGPEFDVNRGQQLKSIQRAVARLNIRGEPVILAGDLNLSAKRTPDLATLNSRLVEQGYVSSVTAPVARNLRFPTYNGGRVAPASASGYASRLDHIYVSGNVYVASHVTQPSRASDHNLVRATVWIR